MKNFDNFDESIKHKMDGMNFQFNDANWEKMSEMIDASRPAKKPFASVPLISSIILGSAIVVGSVLYMMSGSSEAKEVAHLPAVQAVNTNAVLVDANSNANNNVVVNSNVSTNHPVSTHNNNVTTSSNEHKTSTTNSNNSIVASNNTERDQLAGKNEKNVADMNYEKTSAKATQNSDLNSNSSFAKKSEASDSDTKTETTATDNNSKEIVGKEEGAHLKTQGNADVKMSKSTTESSIKPSLEKVAEQQANIQATEQTTTNTDSEEADLVAMPTMTTTLGQTADEIAAANLKTATVEEKKAWEYVRVKHHTVSLEGGAINSFGWAVNKTRNGNNLSPVLGINYMYNINSRSSILFGLQYNSIANLGQAKVDFSVTTYGFGVNNDVTTYKLTDLHYAVMPIKYIHRINKNNALGFGANMMYLMNTRTKITKTTMIENNVSTSDSHYEMGYGFNQLNMFNTQLALSYHHNISNKLAMNVELNKALLNVVKDYRYFGAKNTNSAPAAIKLSLTYTLFNK